MCRLKERHLKNGFKSPPATRENHFANIKSFSKNKKPRGFSKPLRGITMKKSIILNLLRFYIANKIHNRTINSPDNSSKLRKGIR